MNRTLLLQHMQISDLNENHQRMAEIIGLDNYLKLVEEYGDTIINIPSMSFVARGFKYACILREFDGTNLSLLATKYNVSERTVYRLLNNEIQI